MKPNQKNNLTKLDKFKKWVDGEIEPTIKTELTDYYFEEPETKEDTALKPKKTASESLHSFLSRYKGAASLIAALLFLALVVTVTALPPFGNASNPTNNEVTERYITQAEEETGAENVIAGMILNYRGFDTFGESCVLFLAASCVMMLLGRDKNTFKKDDLIIYEKELEAENTDIILKKTCQVLIPCVLLFGLYILFYGHISPGGGFSGGSVLGASLILFSLAFGPERTSKFMNRKTYNIIRISGLCIYGVMFFVYIFCGQNGIDTNLAKYIVLVVDIAVGLVVMTTMYGFYAYMTKGEL